MQNILYTSSFASLQGGGQRSLFLLLKYLNKEEFTPFLIVPEKDELYDEALKLGVKTFVLAFPKIRSLNILSAALSFLRLLSIVRKEHIRLIHTESPRETAYAFFAGKFSGVPVALHARVSDSFAWLDRILYRLADSIIAVSFSVGERFTRLDNENKVKIVYNGVELDKFNVPPDGEERKKKLAIGYFGRIDRRKGIELLINAVKRIEGALELTIMGDGDREYLQELKEIALDPRITFRPYKAEIRNDIASVDIVALPAFKGEGMPRIIIEAMAMGKVTLASDVPPHREVLGDELKEFIFPVKDECALKDIIEKIMRSKNILSDKKEYIRKRAEELFDIRKNTEMIEKLYGHLLE